MSTDTQLREHLQSRADAQTISVSSLQDITTAGDRSLRRTRLTSGFCVIALAMVGLFGFAGLRSTDTPETMFAGLQEDVGGSPATIISTEDGWLGAVLVPVVPMPADGWVGEIYLATSDDGESWELAEPTGLTATSPAIALDEHDGRHWLALTEDNQVYLASSADLERWTRSDIPEASEFELEIGDGMELVVSARQIVASEAGVMAMIEARQQPAFEQLIDIDRETTCAFRWSPATFDEAASVDIRPCGESTWESYDVGDFDLDIGRPETNLVLSTDGETFEVIDRPHSDRVVLPFSDLPNLYSTDTGFGIAGYGLLESDDGSDWATIDLGRFSSPALAAARGDQRMTTAAAQGASVRVHFRSDEVEWTTYKLDDVAGLAPTEEPRTVSIRALEAGEAGWAMSAFVINYDVLASEFVGETGDVTLQFGDLKLHGTMPGGPAELITADGEVAASWDDFELAQVDSNRNIRIQGGELSIIDSNGQTVLETTRQAFQNELQLATSAPVHVVLFSADGLEWTELHRGLDHLTALAIGDDEVVIAHHTGSGPTSIRLPVDSVKQD